MGSVLHDIEGETTFAPALLAIADGGGALFSADDAADVGVDEGTNVTSAYKERDNAFTGRIEKIAVHTR